MAGLPRDEVAVYEDEVDIHLNPKIGLDWMGHGQQKEVLTPGQNEKRYLAGALDVRSNQVVWVEAKRMMADPSIRLLVLDELNIALRYDYLPLAEVVAALAERRPDLHVVVTGRNAKPEMIEAADCVTEFALVKHHFAAGVRAQEAIEF